MILISVLSLIIGLLYLAWFRSKDLYEPEPWTPLIIAMLAGGVLSVFISLFIYNFVPLEQNFLDAFGVGLVEEFGKGLEGDFFIDKTMRMLYATDASVYKEMPLAVARPKSEDDVKNLILFLKNFGTQINISGLILSKTTLMFHAYR